MAVLVTGPVFQQTRLFRPTVLHLLLVENMLVKHEIPANPEARLEGITAFSKGKRRRETAFTAEPIKCIDGHTSYLCSLQRLLKEQHWCAEPVKGT